MNLQKEKILMTGCSGRVARQIIYELDKINVKPIAHLRESSNSNYVDSLGLEKRFADLREREQLPDLVEGIDYIIHTVARINFHQDRTTQTAGLNTIAAIDLFKAAKAVGVKKFVHISSTGAIGGVPRDRITEHLKGDVNLADESHEFNLEHLRIPYIQTKHMAEVELKKLCNGTGTELVIVNPSIIMAPSRNKDDQESASKRLPKFVVPDIRNRINLVDLRDVAKGIIAALKFGLSRLRLGVCPICLNTRYGHIVC
jgi:dihydroflavonol-4-reductase